MSTISYRLRCQLYGHEADVRSISTVTEYDGLISGSRDRTARLWRPVDKTSFEQRAVLKDHTNYIIATCYVPPSDSFPDGLIVTGGNDKTICVYSAKHAAHLFTLEGHENTVSTLAHISQSEYIISGSWDSTARIWSLTKRQCLESLIGHSHSVWAAIAVDDVAKQSKLILTASADKLIFCWQNSKKIRTYHGHNGCVRSLITVNNQEFLSSANDNTIKRWNLITAECLQTYEGHTNFIYCITKLSTGHFASVSEDRSLRIWSIGNSESVQTIRLPVTTVWTACTLNNDDIAAGCSDGRIFVFTNDPSRVASAEEIGNYEGELATSTHQVKTGDLGEVKIDDLPGPEALKVPGKRDGATTMINQGGGRVEAYQWSQLDQRWIKIGDVVGSADSAAQGQTSATGEKICYEGKFYDYVFNVELDDRQLKLPYNINEDPWFAAQEFIHRHELNQIFLDQIAQFIMQNTKGMVIDQRAADFTDPFTGGGRYVPGSDSSTGQSGTQSNYDPFTGAGRYVPGNGSNASPMDTGSNADPFTGSGRYVPSGANNVQPKPQSVSNIQSKLANFDEIGDSASKFPQTTYTTIVSGDVTKILGKLKEFNATLSGDGVRLSDNQVDEIENLLNGNMENLQVKINPLFQTLDWPVDKLFPTFDIIRLLVLDNNICKYLFENEEKTDSFFCQLLSHMISTQPANVMLISRTFTNLFVNDLGSKSVVKHFHKILPKTLICLPLSKKNAQVALTSTILNYCIYAYRNNDQRLSRYLYDCYRDIIDIHLESECASRLLLGLGTLFHTNADIVIDARTTTDNSAKRFFKTLEQQASEFTIDTLDCLEKCRKLLTNL